MKVFDIIVEATPSPAKLTQQEIEALAKTWISKNAQEANAIAENSLKKYPDSSMKVFKIIGITALVGTLNMNLYALNEIAKEDLATFRASDPKFAAYTQEQKDEYIKNARDQYYGIFGTQILMKPIILWVRNKMPGVKQLFDIIERGLGPKGKLIGMATVLGLQLALETQTGQEFLGDSIMQLIRFGGSGVAFTWDKLWPEIQKFTHMPVDRINPDTQKAVDNTRKGSEGPPAADYDAFQQASQNLYQKPVMTPGTN